MKLGRQNGYFYLIFWMSIILISGKVVGSPFLTDDPEPVEYHHWEFWHGSKQGSRLSGNPT